MNKITYHKEENYLIPDLILENQEKVIFNKYGRARLNYLKQYRKILYTQLLMNGMLSKHLTDIQKIANKRLDFIIKKLAESENINEELKCSNQLEWVQAMNNIKNRAEKIIYNEIIYV